LKPSKLTKQQTREQNMQRNINERRLAFVILLTNWSSFS